MWKARAPAEHNGLRYPIDLTDAESTIAEPMIPPTRHGGRKRSVNVREVALRWCSTAVRVGYFLSPNAFLDRHSGSHM